MNHNCKIGKVRSSNGQVLSPEEIAIFTLNYIQFMSMIGYRSRSIVEARQYHLHEN